MPKYLKVVCLILALLVIQTLTIALEPAHLKKVPSIKGSTYKIVAGPLADADAKITIADKQITWKQCNNYVCDFKQQNHKIKIDKCKKLGSEICKDPKLEAALYKAITKAHHFRTVGSFIDVLDKHKKLLFRLQKTS